jgi:hypothetical protein
MYRCSSYVLQQAGKYSVAGRSGADGDCRNSRFGKLNGLLFIVFSKAK